MENMDDMDMDEHTEMMDDGRTIMAMAGGLSPAVLYVSPGQELRVVNHESFSVELVFPDAELAVDPVAPGEEVEFTAPQEPGAYEYHSSQNEEVTGTIVVEM